MLIVLLTDFGNKDWFVGVMKGVILRINPNVNVIDLSHEITPQNVKEAGFILWNAYKFFPKGTIFVCVVDPTVGGDRKIIAVQTKEHIFIAPDNGILDLVLSEVDVLKAVYVENRDYFLENVSTTFHGRDIFAPVAAYISRGVDLSELGGEVNLTKPENLFIDVFGSGDYIGEVIYIDRFGNLITNIRPTVEIDGEVKIKEYVIEKISKTYAEVKSGQLVALINSSGLLEIGVRDGNARDLTKSGYGERIFLKVKRI